MNARWDGVRLTITTRRRGKDFVAVYLVQDAEPDCRVAFPAWHLIKDDGEIWTVAVDEFGPVCSCPTATFRGQGKEIQCKHIAACLAVGLIPKRKQR